MEPIFLLISLLIGLSSFLGLGISVTIGGPTGDGLTTGPLSQGVTFCYEGPCTCLNPDQSPTCSQSLIPVNAGQPATKPKS